MPRRVVALAVATLAITLAMCLAVFGYAKYVRVMGHVESLRQHLHSLEARGPEELLSAVQDGELEKIRGELLQAGQALRALKAELGPALSLAPHLGWLPVVGGDVAAGPDLLEMGIAVSTAGDLMLEGLSPLVAVLDGSNETPSNGSVLEAVAEVVADGQGGFRKAQTELDAAKERRLRLEEDLLSPKVGQLVTRLDKYLLLLDSGVQGLLVAPYLLGVDSPRTYLLLAQNEDELRATGGFISSVALLRIDDGEMEDLDFRDSYAVDDLSQPHPDAPEPLERFMLSQIWLLRDANWYADYPSSAKVASDLYLVDQGVSVDGVVAADLTAMESLLAALGSIYLDEYEQEVTGASAVELMRRYWASPSGEGQTGDWWIHRKDFMGELLGGMMTKLETDVASIDLPRLMEVLGRALEEKHILVSVEDPMVSRVLEENGWDGAVRAADGDFLMVVDTNMGFNKVNPNIESTVEYLAVIDGDGVVTSRLKVSYSNNSAASGDDCVQQALYLPTYQEMMEGCYWNYLRVYVPENSQLVQGPQVTVPEGSLLARHSDLGGTSLPVEASRGESGNDVLAVFLVVAPAERREMAFEYRLPASTLEADGSSTTYRLLVQKQPGTQAVPLRVEVELPTGSVIVSTSPEASEVADSGLVFETDLRVDREFEVVFR